MYVYLIFIVCLYVVAFPVRYRAAEQFAPGNQFEQLRKIGMLLNIQHLQDTYTLQIRPRIPTSVHVCIYACMHACESRLAKIFEVYRS